VKSPDALLWHQMVGPASEIYRRWTFFFLFFFFVPPERQEVWTRGAKRIRIGRWLFLPNAGRKEGVTRPLFEVDWRVLRLGYNSAFPPPFFSHTFVRGNSEKTSNRL